MLRTLLISLFSLAVFCTAMEDTIVYLLSSDDSKTEMTKETEKEEKRENEKEIDEDVEFCNEIDTIRIAQLDLFFGHKRLELVSIRNSCLLPVITPPPEHDALLS